LIMKKDAYFTGRGLKPARTLFHIIILCFKTE